MMRFGVFASSVADGGFFDRAVFVSGQTTGDRLVAYRFGAVDGFGPRFASPAVLPGGDADGVALHPNGTQLAFAGGVVPPRVGAYDVTLASFGTKYAGPAVGLPAAEGGLDFHPAGNAVAANHDISGGVNISAWAWSGAGFGTRFADPAVMAGNAAGGTPAFHPGGAHVYSGAGGAGRPYVYNWSGGGFGTLVAQPGTIPGTSMTDATWSPSGGHLFLSNASSPFIDAYPWAGGFGTKVANPAVLATGQGRGVQINPAQNRVALATLNTPFIIVYEWTGTAFGAKIADPASLPVGGGGLTTRWSSNGDALLLTVNGATTLQGYAFTAGSFGVRFASPAVSGMSNGQRIAISQN